jgi:DNA-binding CsgD family transcriptional regulator
LLLPSVPLAEDGQITGPSDAPTLTSRDNRVMEEAGRRGGRAALGAVLGLASMAKETVKRHVSRVPSKLGLRVRTQAVVAAYESGLVVPGTGER